MPGVPVCCHQKLCDSCSRQPGSLTALALSEDPLLLAEGEGDRLPWGGPVCPRLFGSQHAKTMASHSHQMKWSPWHLQTLWPACLIYTDAVCLLRLMFFGFILTEFDLWTTCICMFYPKRETQAVTVSTLLLCQILSNFTMCKKNNCWCILNMWWCHSDRFWSSVFVRDNHADNFLPFTKWVEFYIVDSMLWKRLDKLDYVKHVWTELLDGCWFGLKSVQSLADFVNLQWWNTGLKLI